MTTESSNAARIPVSLSSSGLPRRRIANLGFCPSPQRCSSTTAYGLNIRICKFNNPPHLTRHLLLTAASVDDGITTETVGNENQASAPPSTSFNFDESVSRIRRIVSNGPPPLMDEIHNSVIRFRQVVSNGPPPVFMDSINKSVSRFHQIVGNLPPPAMMIKRQPGADFLLGFFAATVCLVIAVKIYLGRRPSYDHPSTVADLVRRGQLRTDRRALNL